MRSPLVPLKYVNMILALLVNENNYLEFFIGSSEIFRDVSLVVIPIGLENGSVLSYLDGNPLNDFRVMS